MKVKGMKDKIKTIALAFAVLSIFIITSGFTSCSTIADAGTIGMPNMYSGCQVCSTCGGQGSHKKVGGFLGLFAKSCPNSNVNLVCRM